MKKLLLVFAFAGLLGAPTTASADHGNNAKAHWDRNTVKLIDSVEGTWDVALANTSNSWDAGLTKIATNVVAGSSDASTRAVCRPGRRSVRVCNGDYNFPVGVIGQMQFTYSLPSRHITKARVRLDDSTAEGSRFATTLHEVGHALGLDHDAAPTSCMNAVVNPAIVAPNAHDYEAVDRLHRHRDAKIANATTADAGDPSSGDDPHRRVTRRGDEVTVTWTLHA